MPQYYNSASTYSTSSNPSLSGGWSTGSSGAQYSVFFAGAGSNATVLGYPVTGSYGTDQNATGRVVVGGTYKTGPTGLTVSQGEAYFHGMSTTSGTQSVRLVIYPDNGSGAPSTTPAGVSDPVTVTQSTPAGWLSFPSWAAGGGPPTLAPDSTYWIGIWWGTQSSTAEFQVSLDANGTVPQYYNLSATYSQASNPTLTGGWTTGATGQQYSINFIGGGGRGTEYSYNADDQLTLVTDPDGQQTLTCYDGDGNLTETVPPVGVAANTLTASSCPSSYPTGYGDRLASDATTYSYDALGDKTTITTPAPAGLTGHETTTNAYDVAGRLISVTAPPGSTSGGAPNEVTNYTYDNAGELTNVTKQGSDNSVVSTTVYCYDPNGNKTASVPPDGNTSSVATCASSSPYQTSSSYQTGYSYDSLGELYSKTTPTTSFATSPTSNYTYDAAGNLLTSEDPNTITTTNTYTPLDQLATISYSGSSAHSVSYSYDANGNRLSMTDATGTSSYTYDPFNELTGYTNGAGNTINYGYDSDGNTTTISYPLGPGATWANGNTVSYSYDKADQLTALTDFNGHTTSISNTGDGLPTTLTLGSSSGDTISTSYDPTDTPSAITLSNGTTLQKFSYSDVPSGAISAETDTPSSSLSPADYTYDAQNRVTQMTPGTTSSHNYTFDASGNLTQLPTGTSSTSYDHASELTSSTLSGTTTSYTYNADGQRTAETGGSTVTASYNGAQELTAYNNSAANMKVACYDGDGLRQTLSTSSTSCNTPTNSFTWDISGSLPHLLIDTTNAYIYGPGNTPIEQLNLTSGTTQYLVSDLLGSVRGIVTSAGSLTATTSYDAWGNPETTGGLTTYTPIGYAGSYTDPTGLTYNIGRYYDSATGQFVSVDPLVDETGEAYAYAVGDPVTRSDPSGLSVACPSTAAMADGQAGTQYYLASYVFPNLRGSGRGEGYSRQEQELPPESYPAWVVAELIQEEEVATGHPSEGLRSFQGARGSRSSRAARSAAVGPSQMPTSRTYLQMLW